MFKKVPPQNLGRHLKTFEAKDKMGLLLESAAAPLL